MQNNNDELIELKSLLFEEEIDTFDKIEKKIANLDFSLHDKAQIIARISPLFNKILLKQLEDKESDAIQIYATHLATIINTSANQDISSLSASLQSIISPAISKEIEDNQDKMVDALYPIMGSMISKYVSNAIQELMESINNKIEDGLSLNKYKRKVKAKVSGVSETEILLNESNYAEIRALFIIQKESGLLIAEEHLDNQKIEDPHMVASMASAIKDFVNDWVSTNTEVSEVQLLSYGNATLYIESAGSVYLIAFLNAEPDYEERNEIQRFFVQIIRKYTPFFHTFNGDDNASEIITIKQNMQKFLNKEMISDTQEKKKSNVAKYLLTFLLLLLLTYMGYVAKEKYMLHTLEQNVFEKTGESIVINKVDGSYVLHGHVKTTDKYNEVENLMHSKGYMNVNNEIYFPPSAIKPNVLPENKEIQILENTFKAHIQELKSHIVNLESNISKLTVKYLENKKELIKIKLWITND